MNQIQAAAAAVTQEQVDRIKRVSGFLTRLCKDYAAARSDLHWINARNADADDGANYCYDCACKKVAELDAKAPDSEHYVAGGGGFRYEDSPAVCQTCGETLECGLTLAGVEYELDHFDHPDHPDTLDLTGPGAPSVAYSLNRIFEYAWMEGVGGMTEYSALMASRQQQRVIALSERVEAIRMAAETPTALEQVG